MDQPSFSAAFKGSPMKRAKRRGLARNAAVALGNVGTIDDVPVLEAALAHDEPLVRAHVASALERLQARTPARVVAPTPAAHSDQARGSVGVNVEPSPGTLSPVGSSRMWRERFRLIASATPARA